MIFSSVFGTTTTSWKKGNTTVFPFFHDVVPSPHHIFTIILFVPALQLHRNSAQLMTDLDRATQEKLRQHTKLEEIESLNRILQHQNHDLVEQLETNTASLAQLELLTQRQEKAGDKREQEFASVKTQLADLRRALNLAEVETESAARRFNSRVSELEAAEDRAEGELANERKLRQAAEVRVAEMDFQQRQLAKDFSKMSTEKEELSVELRSKEKEKEIVQEFFVEKQALCAELEAEITKTKTRCAELETGREEWENAKGEFVKTQQKLETEYREELSRKEELKSQLALAEKKGVGLGEEIVGVRADCDAAFAVRDSAVAQQQLLERRTDILESNVVNLKNIISLNNEFYRRLNEVTGERFFPGGGGGGGSSSSSGRGGSVGSSSSSSGNSEKEDMESSRQRLLRRAVAARIERNLYGGSAARQDPMNSTMMLERRVREEILEKRKKKKKKRHTRHHWGDGSAGAGPWEFRETHGGDQEPPLIIRAPVTTWRRMGDSGRVYNRSASSAMGVSSMALGGTSTIENFGNSAAKSRVSFGGGGTTSSSSRRALFSKTQPGLADLDEKLVCSLLGRRRARRRAFDRAALINSSAAGASTGGGAAAPMNKTTLSSSSSSSAGFAAGLERSGGVQRRRSLRRAGTGVAALSLEPPGGLDLDMILELDSFVDQSGTGDVMNDGDGGLPLTRGGGAPTEGSSLLGGSGLGSGGAPTASASSGKRLLHRPSKRELLGLRRPGRSSHRRSVVDVGIIDKLGLMVDPRRYDLVRAKKLHRALNSLPEKQLKQLRLLQILHDVDDYDGVQGDEDDGAAGPGGGLVQHFQGTVARRQQRERELMNMTFPPRQEEWGRVCRGAVERTSRNPKKVNKKTNGGDGTRMLKSGARLSREEVLKRVTHTWRTHGGGGGTNNKNGGVFVIRFLPPHPSWSHLPHYLSMYPPTHL